MKKKLEADLISIAHRILKLKNKSELVQLHQETQKLYEKLSVLLFDVARVHDAVFGSFNIRPQELVAKVACNLHHALGRIGLYGVELGLVDDAVLQAIGQHLFKKRAGIKQRDGLRRCGRGREDFRHGQVRT